MKGLTAIIQTTENCNLACKYCYISDERKDMNIEVLKTSIDKLSKAIDKGGRLRITWHGGEPLSRGLDFYLYAQELLSQHKNGIHVSQGMQTNGTLVDEEVIDFSKKHDIGIGLSIDGPEDIHNANRIYHKGGGSFTRAMESLNLLRKHQLPTGAISVFTKKSIGREEDIYGFFKENKLNVQINPLALLGKSKRNEEEIGVTSKEYGKAMSNLFLMWFYEKNPTMKFDNFWHIMGAIATGTPTICTYSNNCCGTSYISICPNGDVYPCNRFSWNETFLLGNIMEQNLDDMFSSDVLQEFRNRKDLKSCQPCEYHNICNGGCSGSAYSHTNRIMSKDYYCTAIKTMFKTTEKALRTELEKVELRG